ncbi:MULTISPECIES: ERF family protein [unclassified Streptomyces]|uniref:ERF family protein n=1 Tax=unclassified Streptomyces TaxID=2593676 RepID=UPI00344EB904
MTVTALPLPPAPTMPTAPVAAPIYQPAPAGAPDDTPRVFAAISAVMRDVMPVAKDKENQQQRYKFRGVDDAMSAMAGPMRAHGLFILPSIADHRAERRGEKMTHVNITMRYHVYGPAGDCLTAEVPGEASDFADKATNKAQSAALKYLLFTLFMIPVDGRSIDDSDHDTPTEPPAEHRAERQQRQQQRAQQRQQRGQQPRRSQRAEPGPWEQAPQQGDGLSPQARELIAAAQAAASPVAFAEVRTRAEKSGAPADFLARLDRIDAEKRKAAQKGARQAPQQGEQATPPPTPPKSPEAAAADAENALRLAASKANLANLDADFERVYGLPIEQATAQQLDTFRAKVEAAAGGAK